MPRSSVVKLSRLLVGLGLLGSALFVAYAVGSARADGIPSPATLAFSGSLLTFGTPDNSTHQMSVALFNGTTQECATSTASVACVNGQFSIPLVPSTPSCVTAVQTYPNLQAQVTIDGTLMGMNPITAVPYSVMSGSAVNADTATNATGALTPSSVTATGAVLGGHTVDSWGVERTGYVSPSTTGVWNSIPGLSINFTLLRTANVQMQATGVHGPSATSATSVIDSSSTGFLRAMRPGERGFTSATRATPGTAPGPTTRWSIWRPARTTSMSTSTTRTPAASSAAKQGLRWRRTSPAI